MNKRFVFITAIAAVICCWAHSCSQRAANDLQVVDVIGAINREKAMKLSDLVESVEYVKLETTPECLLGEGITVKAGDRLYIHNFKTKQILAYNRNGKFTGRIGSQGQGPGEYVNFAHFDVSPDNQLLALGGFGEITLYSTGGQFLRRGRLDNGFPFLSGFLFLDRSKLVTHNARMNFSQEGYPMMLVWDTDNLEADTVLRVDLKPLESELVIPFLYTAFYPYRETVCFMEAANDTLYELSRELKICAKWIFNCGDLALREENLFKTSGKASIKVYPVCETSNFLLFGASKGDDYCLMAFNKKSGETFRLPEGISPLDGKSITYGPQNDLDGIDFSFNGAKINDGVWCSALQIADLKSFFESGKTDNLNLRNKKYIDQLRELTNASDLNDNPIIRIIHWK